MWSEPLTARVAEANRYAFDVVVAEAAGRDVARVRCPISIEARCGVFGEIEIADESGTQRQRLRTMVLLIREALRYGAEIGIAYVSAEVPARLESFVSLMSGIDGAAVSGGRRRYLGELHAVQSRALDESNASGDLVRASREAADALAVDA